jgi:hypothetical protein
MHHCRTCIQDLTTFFYLKFYGTWCLPIFAKGSNKTCCKRSHYIGGFELGEHAKEVVYIYWWNFKKQILLPKWILKNKIII